MKRFKTCIQPFLIGALLAAAAIPAWAHDLEEHKTTAPHKNIAVESKVTDETLTRQIWFKPKLQAQAPLETTFQDETGKTVPLRQYFGTKPVVLVLIYYRCATMCIAALETLESSLHEIEFNAGREFDVVAVSIDPRETPALAMTTKQQYVQRYGRPGTDRGWHFLTGNRSAIRSLAQASGFGYAFNTATGEYAHPNGILVLTPQGRISRFFSEFDYPSQDLRLSLIEASAGSLGTPLDKVLLLGLSSNPATGKYEVNITKVVGLATSLLSVFLCLFLVMARRRRNEAQAEVSTPRPEHEREMKGATS